MQGHGLPLLTDVHPYKLRKGFETSVLREELWLHYSHTQWIPKPKTKM